MGQPKRIVQVACIGCGKCFKVCKFDAITMKDNLAYIDPLKCKLCRKCEPECPTGAIHELNFPPRKVKVEGEKPERKPVPKAEVTVEKVEVKVTATEEKPMAKEAEIPQPKKEEGNNETPKANS